MDEQRSPRHRRAGFALAAVASLALTAVAGGTSYAGAGSLDGSDSAPPTRLQSVRDQVLSGREVDVTASDSVGRAHALGGRGSAPAPDGTVRELSPTTGTVRYLADLDGYLTAARAKPAPRIALGYVRSHAPALGLARSDARTFHLVRDYRDITGTHHLSFIQRIEGTTVAGHGLTASVSRGGHLLTLGGMPVSRADHARLPAASTHTITSAAEALAQARGPAASGTDTSTDTDTRADASVDTAQRVVFETGHGLRPAWETVVTSSPDPAVTVIDAVTGQVLLRSPMTHYEHSTGRAFRFFPGAARGGRQVEVDFTARGWLGGRARSLAGNNAHVYSDVDDNDRPSRAEEVRAKRGQSWGYRLKPFHLGFATSFCGKPWPCSWNPDRAYSWERNRAQNATQVFFFVNNWHDHLLRAPIGFTEAAGNFQLANRGEAGKAGDPLRVQTDDGAATGRGRLEGLPDSHHIDNANMSTPPDGHRPTMQMYLQHEPFTDYPREGPWSPTNSGDIADTVYHEYTHGLSGRLVVDVRGREALDPVQGDAMGEGWSDWYAMDFLVAQHLQRDRRGVADVRLGVYEGKGVDLDRTEPMDCKVGQRAELCNGGRTGHRGGYTLSDFGRVFGEPEVHADGEIWAQTLWDLRDRLGSHTTESLVTRGMELAPANPSFLDMRNAILVADNAVYGGRHLDAVWQVFAHRGMGYDASSDGGRDTHPTAGFDLPPQTLRHGVGTVVG